MPLTIRRKGSEVDLSRVRKKLEEAQFFLGKMVEQEPLIVGGEPFDSYLSAFLNEAMSARNGFQVRQDRRRNAAIKACEQWENNLCPEERPLYDFMREDRVAEHHSPAGSSRNVGQESVAFGIGEHPLPRGKGTLIVSGIPATLSGDSSPPVTTYRSTYSFTVDGTERRATEACREYLALLHRMVAQFEADQP
jgi:hypothetical protein